jgi:hypothetical protein
MAKKQKGLNPELETAIEKLLEDVMADPMASLTDKCKVLDRAINVEKLKQKLSDEEWGSGFITPDDDDA